MAPKRKSQSRITASLLEVKQPMDEARRQGHRRARSRMGLRLRPRFGGGEGHNLQVRAARDHTCVHKFPNAVPPEKSWQLHEMGVSGNGSQEHGDSSGDQTFLK